MNVTIGTLIRDAREAQGITQRHLAERLGDLGWQIDPTAVTRIEHDQRSIRVSELALVAEALRTSVHDLIPYTGSDASEYRRGFVAGRAQGIRDARAALDQIEST